MSKTTLETKEKSISDLIRHQVIDVFREILSDPDRGLALRESFVHKIKKSIRSKKSGRVKNLLDVLTQY